MLQKHLLVWLVISSLLALFWPQLTWLGSAQWDPFLVLARKEPLWGLIILTMLSIGWMLPRSEVNQVLSRWPTVLGGVTLQYLSMPLLAYLCILATGVEGSLMIGIVIVGCVPGAMASNVLTLNAKGNPSYSVSLTTTATLLSPLAVPLALRCLAWLLGDPAESEALEKLADPDTYWKSAESLLYRVVCPVIVGHCLGRVFHRWEKEARKIFPEIANSAILLIIAAVVAKNRTNLDHLPIIVFCLLLVLNLGGYLSGYFGGQFMRLPEPMKRALTLEVGMQNAGLGTVLAADLFGAEAAIAPACYTFGCMLTGTVLARYWSSRELKDPAGNGTAPTDDSSRKSVEDQ
ncbi:MAG: bile acid:sodium symporter family protein [Planctomycetota bacterium]|nr:bile acid:sodium symporter family protein [Planctomycetota bacterium]